MIISDKEQLKVKCDPCPSIEEGEEIGAQLLKELTESKKGIGLAANQIGINKRVCVINVKEPIVLINPHIVQKSAEEFVFAEGCLSFPDEKIKTKRYVGISVEADNHPNQLDFSADSEDIQDAFECVCVQHEIDHLDGITMHDRLYKAEPIRRMSPKIGRNDKIQIKKGDELKTIKFKKVNNFLKDGWEFHALAE